MGFVIFWLICAVATGLIAQSKSRSFVLWFLGAFFLTPLMLLVVLCIGNLGNQCSKCKTFCPKDATKCKACGSDLEGGTTKEVKKNSMICPKCKRTYGDDYRTCTYCYFGLEKITPP